ncbi:MAG: SEL1-like repeat protein [Lentisphaerae bacterium]|nr:SEL1-like repeat protein [Lentisphaerota bacterium]MCP4101301.1 SEL1-like repeat protein [Lentisphaerota bacterium]
MIVYKYFTFQFEPELLQFHLKKARAGNAEYQCELGYIYLMGSLTIEKDLDKAFYWYSKAAEQGYPRAYHCIGSFYELTDDYKKQ